MTDPDTRPRDFMHPAHQGNFGKGPAAWALPPNWASLAPADRDRTAWRMAGAAVQHEHARAVTRLVHGLQPAYRDLGHLARRWVLRPRRLRALLRGDVLMLPEDLAAFLVITERDGNEPDGTDPSALRSTVRDIWDSTRPAGGAATGRRRATGLIERTEGDVMIALGGSGFVSVAEPLTDRERSGHARNAVLAPPLVEQAAQTLRRTPGRLPEHAWHTGDDNEILIELRARDLPPASRGAVHDTGVDLTVWLPVDWADRVHDTGLALVDGWFVADLADPGPTGRPERAVVLDMLPLDGSTGVDEDGEPYGDWEFCTRHATLRWDGDQPHVQPISPRESDADARESWRR